MVRIVREFDAPPELVYRAHVDPELVKQWMGPRSIDMDIETWDMRTGGEYRYTALRDGEEVAHFYGSVHRVWENQKIVQTFGFEEMPEAVSLDTLSSADLGDGRTRLEILSVVESMEAQAGMLASGMEVGDQRGLRRPRRAARGEAVAPRPRTSPGSRAIPSRPPRSTAPSRRPSPTGSGASPRGVGRPRARWRSGRHATSYATSWSGSRRSSPAAPTSSCTPGPSVDDDPVAAWEHHAAAVQEVLDDPATADRTFAHPTLPEMPLAQAISRFYTNDVFMHTWDLARATGQDDRLDEDQCRQLFEGMQPMDEVLRQSGQYGAEGRRCPTTPTGRPRCSASSAATPRGRLRAE